MCRTTAKRQLRILGDVAFYKMSDSPALNGSGGLFVEQKASDGRLIVATSETGSHHYVMAEDGVRVFDTSKPWVKFISVKTRVSVQHVRGFDPPEGACLDAGLWRVARQQEPF
jgi:hypothetical protein